MRKFVLLLTLAVVFLFGLCIEAEARRSGRVSVRGYFRKNGTYVRPHTRSYPRSSGYSSSYRSSYGSSSYGRSYGSGSSGYSGGGVAVRGYFRKDGTYVRPHTRSFPGSGSSYGNSSTFNRSGSSSFPAMPRPRVDTGWTQTTPDTDEAGFVDNFGDDPFGLTRNSQPFQGSNAQAPARTHYAPKRATAVESQEMLDQQAQRDAALLRKLGELPTNDATLSGKVIGVTDGDTVTMLVNSKDVTVRLYGVDCPEKGQAFSENATQFTSTLALGKVATLYRKGTDKYGRTVGWLFVGSACVNRELVSNGLAWWYRDYAPSEEKIGFLEVTAKAAKRGLWSETNPIAPWAWR